MTDDDRDLAERLRRYEARIPVGPDTIDVTRPRPVPWAAVAGAAAMIVLAVILASGLLRQQPQIGNASPSAEASHSVAPTSIPSPSATPTSFPSGSPTPAETPAATPAATPTASVPSTPAPTPGPIVRWSTAATFGQDGFAEEVRDVTYGGGHFVAVGYREPLDQRGQVRPPQHDPLIWISPDGSSWESLVLGPEFEDAHLFSVVALPDGAAGIYGYVDLDDRGALESRAWRSSDGRTWQPLELSMPPDSKAGNPSYITRVTDGARGYLTAQRIGLGNELWYSSDGAAWEIVRRFEHPEPGWAMSLRAWGAGDEGFVLVGQSYDTNADDRTYVPFVQASSDGRIWFDADPASMPPGPNLLVAPVRGDWIITQSDFRTGIDTTWFSHDGLHWEERAAIDVPPPTAMDEFAGDGQPVVGTIIGAGDRAFVVGNVLYCCHGPWFAAGIWSSFDATSWERLAFPDDAFIRAAASHGDVTVLAGHTGASPVVDWQARATFWVSGRE